MSFDQAWQRMATLLRSGIAGTAFTPLKLLIVVSATLLLLWVTRRGTRWFVDRVLARRGFDIGMREALGVITRYVIVSLGVLVILQSAGIDLTSLNVLVGAVGVGLGFGLQNITSNFFSGLILLFERPIKIGDRVEIGGVVGEVKEIGARATTIVTDERVSSIVPNSLFVSERVTNWSRPDTLTAYQLTYHVSHASSPDIMRQVLLAAAAAHPDVLANPAAEVEFVEVGLGALKFQLQVWSRQHLNSSGTLKSDLNFEVWRQLGAAGVVVAPPHGVMELGLSLVQTQQV